MNKRTHHRTRSGTSKKISGTNTGRKLGRNLVSLNKINNKRSEPKHNKSTQNVRHRFKPNTLGNYLDLTIELSIAEENYLSDLDPISYDVLVETRNERKKYISKLPLTAQLKIDEIDKLTNQVIIDLKGADAIKSEQIEEKYHSDLKRLTGIDPQDIEAYWIV